MEINALAIGMILIIVFAAPIFFVLFNSTSSNKKIKKKFSSLCAANGLTLTNFDVIGSAVIGLDATVKKIVYSTLADIENRFRIVDLSTVVQCEVKTAQSKKKYLEFVELELTSASGKDDIVVYEEEDETLSTDPNMCLHELKKWEQLIKQQLQ